MNAKEIYKLLSILLGYGLIIASFIIFGENIETNIKFLDIIVSCLILTHFFQFLLFPLINLGAPSNKEVGMMGIHLTALNTCCLLAIGLMVCGIAYHIPFKTQLIGQLAVLLILFIGRVVTLHAGEKVQEVYVKEKKKMEGKTSLRLSMDDFMDYMANVKQLDQDIRDKMSLIHESIRYITPSASLEAKSYNLKISQSLDNLKVLMRNTTINKENIKEEVENLERIISRRKKY